jgi:glycosyltransferase involved in cell wall biosynthesis
MPEQRFKVLAVASHPVQYMAPLFRRMASERELDLQVAYCSLRGGQGGYDRDFRTSVQWDIPLLDGYRWVEVPNKGDGAESFWGLNNPGLRGLIREGKYDAVLCYVGYVRASFWITQRAAKSSGAAFLFGTDAHNLAPRDGKRWKVWFKKLYWPWLFGRADQVFVPSTGTFELIHSLGIAEERITLTPYSVDNEWWKAQSARVDRSKVRAGWGVTTESHVILFCAKLQSWKRPMDLLRAFAQASIQNAVLIYAGDGPQRGELEAEVGRLGLTERVRFLGFVNQTQLPAVYTAADLLVLPSEYEPFAVVVNEAMCCGCPVVASDQVGAARDLVTPIRPEFVFPVGDVAALSNVLRSAFANPESLRETGQRGFAYVEKHSPQETVASTVESVRQAVEHVRSKK